MIRIFSHQYSDGTWETGSFCLLAHKEYNQGGKSMVMIDKFHGLVLKEFEKNWRDDSDFYAIVWDEERKEPFETMFATTRGWTYPCGCVVDATPEVIAQYEAYIVRKEKVWAEYHAKADHHIPKIGRIARSLTTRGKAKDKQGEITWIGNSNYNNSKLVRIDGAYVELDKIEIFDEQSETWLKPAFYSKALGAWHVSESILPSPK